ncbi:hypothetical protein HPP92_002511 [Vanilla planifolia]|uniref:Uncharacterized protein n=1 Tax=Vanilla planifolia TaxID=51239 RepID=A0A835S6I3_VANPL|nr:hypothetical protein HPP92_002876 [Vanilla planifolia]KAG0502439.1 hypothetical protein HPP92_002511 [Vanilla planifolia]
MNTTTSVNDAAKKPPITKGYIKKKGYALLDQHKEEISSASNLIIIVLPPRVASTSATRRISSKSAVQHPSLEVDFERCSICKHQIHHLDTTDFAGEAMNQLNAAPCCRCVGGKATICQTTNYEKNCCHFTIWLAQTKVGSTIPPMFAVRASR